MAENSMMDKEKYLEEIEDSIRTIGVLTSGGDAPGMNAAIRAVVRRALSKGLKVRGIRRGYHGLLKEEIIDLSARDVSDTIQRGGTILQTARCKSMRTEEGQQKAAAICKKYGIDGLVVIGGDGSFAGAQKLANLGVNTIGVPGTIDLDIACTDYTIGFDTAVNTAMEAIDKVRDTSTSHERCSIIEVMGRDAGYLALWCGIANGAERILMPEEKDFDEQALIEDIMKNKKRGKKNYIIINAEGIGDSINMAKRIEEATGIETRATILGHMQRGGSPTCKDRVYASIMGAKAAELRIVMIQHHLEEGGHVPDVLGEVHLDPVDVRVVDEGRHIGIVLRAHVDPPEVEVHAHLLDTVYAAPGGGGHADASRASPDEPGDAHVGVIAASAVRLVVDHEREPGQVVPASLQVVLDGLRRRHDHVRRLDDLRALRVAGHAAQHGDPGILQEG